MPTKPPAPLDPRPPGGGEAWFVVGMLLAVGLAFALGLTFDATWP